MPIIGWQCAVVGYSEALQQGGGVALPVEKTIARISAAQSNPDFRGVQSGA